MRACACVCAIPKMKSDFFACLIKSIDDLCACVCRRACVHVLVLMRHETFFDIHSYFIFSMLIKKNQRV